VADKEKANFCDFYAPTQDRPGGGVALSKTEAEKKWQELAGKK